MSYFFSWIIKKNRAWEESFTAFKSISVPRVRRPPPHTVRIYLMCLTPLFLPSSIKLWFQLRDRRTQSSHRSSAHSLYRQWKDRHSTISPLGAQAICFNPKGSEMRENGRLSLSCSLRLSLSIILFSLSPSLGLIARGEMKRVKRVKEREKWRFSTRPMEE